MFMTAVFSMWKYPQCPSIDEWINKARPIHIIEYYSAIKANDVLTQVTSDESWNH